MPFAADHLLAMERSHMGRDSRCGSAELSSENVPEETGCGCSPLHGRDSVYVGLFLRLPVARSVQSPLAGGESLWPKTSGESHAADHDDFTWMGLPRSNSRDKYPGLLCTLLLFN